MITKAGLYDDIPSEQYHADTCATPSLSSGIVKCILDSSLAHAKLKHPRLNPNLVRKQKREFDIGHVCHQLILGDVDKIRVIVPERYPAKNGNIPTGWTNDAIREARDAAYDAGQIPLLPWEQEQAARMALAVRYQLDEAGIDDFKPGTGKCEQTIVWEESGVWCRIRLDWLPNDRASFPDLKSTDGSANPETWAALQMFSIGADIQAAFYRRGIKAVLGVKDPAFRFIVCEQNEPFCVSIVEPSPRAMEFADLKVDEAIRAWSGALKTNTWPGYPLIPYQADPPSWAEAAWMNKQIAAQSLE